MKDFGKIFGFEREPVEGATGRNTLDGDPAKHTRVTLELRPTIWVDLANAVWSMQNKSLDPITHERREEFRSLGRHIDRLSECLDEIGLETISHTNQVFDPGQSLEVIAFQPTVGISRELIVETIRPTLYLKGHRLQMGQVIVATPNATEEGGTDA